MRRHPLLPAAILLLLLAGPSDAPGAASEPRFPLFDVPPDVVRICHRAQESASFPILCPTRLPRASIGSPEYPPNPLTADILRDGRKILGMEFNYGAPYPTREWRNHPGRFLHLAVLQADAGGFAAIPEDSRSLGPRRLAGRAGTLVHAPPFAEGGGYHGNHLLFTWRENGAGYTISLHSWRRAEALRLLQAVIAGLRPAASLASPEPEPTEPDLVRVRIGEPSAMAITDDALWVSEFVVPGAVHRVDIDRLELVGDPVRVGRYPGVIVADEEDVWALGLTDSLERIDVRSGRITATIPLGASRGSIAVGDRYVWVASYERGSLLRIDPETNRVAGRPIDVGGGPIDIAISNGSVWVTDFDRGRALRVNESTGAVIAEIPVGRGISGIAATPEAVWVPDFDSDELVRIDPSENRVVARVAVGAAPSGVAVMGSSVLVPDYWDGTVRRVDTETNEVTDRVWGLGLASGIVAGEDAAWVLDLRSGSVVRIPFEAPLERAQEQGGSRWPIAIAAVALVVVTVGLVRLTWSSPFLR